MYYDIESGEYITTADLQREYTALKAAGHTEAESFSDYITNCLEGTLERV